MREKLGGGKDQKAPSGREQGLGGRQTLGGESGEGVSPRGVRVEPCCEVVAAVEFLTVMINVFFNVGHRTDEHSVFSNTELC